MNQLDKDVLDLFLNNPMSDIFNGKSNKTRNTTLNTKLRLITIFTSFNNQYNSYMINNIIDHDLLLRNVRNNNFFIYMLNIEKIDKTLNNLFPDIYSRTSFYENYFHNDYYEIILSNIDNIKDKSNINIGSIKKYIQNILLAIINIEIFKYNCYDKLMNDNNIVSENKFILMFDLKKYKDKAEQNIEWISRKMNEYYDINSSHNILFANKWNNIISKMITCPIYG